MTQSDLRSEVSKLEPVRVEGVFERHTSLRWPELQPSRSGGRWGARRAHDVLYLGRPRDSIVAEAYRHLVDDDLDDSRKLAAAVLERRLVIARVDISGIVDIRSRDAREKLQLTDDEIFSSVGDYQACQRVGAAAFAVGSSGIIAPSATRLGETLALFTAHIGPADWPVVIRRDIWSSLPPDPRMAA